MKKLYDIKKFTELEYILYCALSKDKNNPVSKNTIYNLTGIKEREVKQLIKQLRKKGVPISSQISHGGGYWIEEDKKEFGRFVRQQQIELDGYKKTLEILKNIYKSLPGEDPNELFI